MPIQYHKIHIRLCVEINLPGLALFQPNLPRRVDAEKKRCLGLKVGKSQQVEIVSVMIFGNSFQRFVNHMTDRIKAE